MVILGAARAPGTGVALELLEQAVVLHPRDLELLHLGIELAREAGDEDRAAEWERRAQALGPDTR